MAAVFKYGLIAVAVAWGTWYALHTYDRAQLATRLEAQIAERNRADKAVKEFNAKVDGIRQTVETRMNDFNTKLGQIGEARRERIIERIPQNSRVCLTADVVRLLNDADRDQGGSAATAGSADGPADNYTILTGP